MSKQLRSNSSSSKNKSESDMSVTDLAKLMKSEFASYQKSTSEELKRMSDTMSQFASSQKSSDNKLERMSESLSAQIEKLKSDISADMKLLREENNTTIRNLTKSIEEVKTEAVLSVDQNSRMNDLIVSGVPFTPEENLHRYFSTWCRLLGYPEDVIPLVDIRRLSKGAPKAGTASLILIQFAITIQRNDFFAHYLKSRNLSLSQIGFSVNKRIYINENLGPTSRGLRSKALAMKRNGQLTGVFTKDGTVYVKEAGSDRAVAVRTENQLGDIVHR